MADRENFFRFRQGKRKSFGNPSGAVVADMGTDINALTITMLRFAGLLRLLSKSGLAQNYEAVAVELRTDSSPQAVRDARVFILDSFRGGPGGLTDQYVQKKDGSVDEVLNAEYERLLQDLTDFANEA